MQLYGIRAQYTRVDTAERNDGNRKMHTGRRQSQTSRITLACYVNRFMCTSSFSELRSRGVLSVRFFFFFA